MRGAIFGAVGLILGALAALGYSHYFGEGKDISDLQKQVASLQSDLTSSKTDTQLAKRENSALNDQVQQLLTTKDKLQKQADGQGSSGMQIPMPPGFKASDMAGIVKAQLAQRNEQKLRMLELRLHLTPDQLAKIKAAMEIEDQRTQGMTEKFLAGQKVDYQSVMKDMKDFKSVDQTIAEVLTPDQKTAYQQIQTDEKKSQAETTASLEMNQVSPLLNLNDSQKDQVETALYQVQLDTQDPKWMQKNVTNSLTDPTAILEAEEKAKEDALASILTPDQLAAFKQQSESQLNMQKSMMQKFMPAGGFSAMVSGGQNGGGATATGSAAPAPANAPNP